MRASKQQTDSQAQIMTRSNSTAKEYKMKLAQKKNMSNQKGFNISIEDEIQMKKNQRDLGKKNAAPASGELPYVNRGSDPTELLKQAAAKNKHRTNQSDSQFSWQLNKQ